MTSFWSDGWTGRAFFCAPAPPVWFIHIVCNQEGYQDECTNVRRTRTGSDLDDHRRRRGSGRCRGAECRRGGGGWSNASGSRDPARSDLWRLCQSHLCGRGQHRPLWPDRGLRAEDAPIMAFSVAEDELREMDKTALVGHWAAWNYYQSVDTPQNEQFVTNSLDTRSRRHPETTLTSSPLVVREKRRGRNGSRACGRIDSCAGQTTSGSVEGKGSFDCSQNAHDEAVLVPCAQFRNHPLPPCKGAHSHIPGFSPRLAAVMMEVARAWVSGRHHLQAHSRHDLPWKGLLN